MVMTSGETLMLTYTNIYLYKEDLFMKKKVLSLVLSAVMVASVFAACGSETTAPAEDTTTVETTDDAAATTDDAAVTDDTATADIDISEPVTLKWYLHGSNVTDDAEVLAAANEYLGEKLNVTLEPIWGTWGDFDSNAVLALQAGDPIDIYFTCSWSANEYVKYARDGYWVRLDDPENNLLEKYAPDLFSKIPSVLADGAVVDGASGTGIYAIPGYKDIATQYCWDVNVTLLEELGYTLDDLQGKSFYDFGEFLQAAKDAKGDSFYPLLVEGGVLVRMVTNSLVFEATNILAYYVDPANPANDLGNSIVNAFATEEYKKFVEKVREYYELGYIDPACANAQQANDIRTAKQLEGDYLIGTQSYAYGCEIQYSEQRGIEVGMVPTTPPFVDTTSSRGAMMAISTASANPERALMFLNLLNTDPYLMTLLNYGVEGVHYTAADDGCIEFTDKRADYQPWTNGMGNVMLLPNTVAEGPTYRADFEAYYSKSVEVPTLGFTFDPTNVETEIATVSNVVGEYSLPLAAGAAPEGTLDEFLKKLEDAGIQKIVDEANAQLEAFNASK